MDTISFIKSINTSQMKITMLSGSKWLTWNNGSSTFFCYDNKSKVSPFDPSSDLFSFYECFNLFFLLLIHKWYSRVDILQIKNTSNCIKLMLHRYRAASTIYRNVIWHITNQWMLQDSFLDYKLKTCYSITNAVQVHVLVSHSTYQNNSIKKNNFYLVKIKIISSLEFITWCLIKR